MPLHLASRRRSAASLAAAYPGAALIDVTSRAALPWQRFSPFYPHGGIPVPFSPGVAAQSVEGIWQGLKVFAGADIDVAKFEVTSMKGLKRTVRSLGAVRSHRRGLGGTELLAYGEARRAIYLPCYRWVLDHCLQAELAELRTLAERGEVVLLDYETNADVADLKKPLSHAALIIAHLSGRWPTA